MCDGVVCLRIKTIEDLAELLTKGGNILIPKFSMCAPHIVKGLKHLTIDRENERINLEGRGSAGKYNFLTIEKITKAKDKKKKDNKIITHLGELYLTFSGGVTREDVFKTFPPLEEVLEVIKDSDIPLADEIIDWNPITCEAKAWHSILTRLQKFYLKGIEDYWSGFPLESTPGSTGITMEKILLPEDVLIPISGKALLKYIKSCFRGARVQSYCNPGEYKGQLVEIDLNGHYSSMGKLPLPVGVPGWEKPSIEELLKEDSKLSLVDCRVSFIDKGDNIGPLPVKGDNITAFPTEGVYRGVWTSPELKAGIKYGKLKILEIFVSPVWDKKSFTTKLFQNLTWLMMQKAPCKGIRDHVKLMRTFHHGKFSQSLTTETIHFGESPKDLKNSEKILVPEEQMETGGDPYFSNVWSEETETVRSYSIPHIGVFISSYGRIVQHDWLMKVISKGYKVLHTNNDSMWINGEPKEEWMDTTKDGYFKVKQRADRLYIASPYVVIPFKDGKSLVSALPGMKVDKNLEEDARYHAMGYPNAIRTIQTVIKVKDGKVYEEEELRVLRK